MDVMASAKHSKWREMSRALLVLLVIINVLWHLQMQKIERKKERKEKKIGSTVLRMNTAFRINQSHEQTKNGAKRLLIQRRQIQTNLYLALKACFTSVYRYVAEIE